MTKTFPKLYKRTGTGAIQTWEIRVDKNAIYTRFGRLDGAIQESAPDIILEGKNQGKANATTAEQQAMLEAQAEWEKKLKRGYTESQADADAGKTSDLVEGGVWPMLAKRFDKDGDKIVWPAYAQPKFDGHRCIAVVDADGQCTLWSRTRKPITGVPHIVRAIEDLSLQNIVFDGELYNCDYHDKFEELTHFIRQKTPIAGHEVVQYHIYDLADLEATFDERTKRIAAIIPDDNPTLIKAETIVVDDESALILAFEHYRSAGFEGCMVRNAAGLYESHPSHRSNDLQKIKQFEDAEFEIVGVTEGRGKLAGHGIFVCKTEAGNQFEAKLIGELASLKKYFEKPDTVIGRMLTVQFQGYTKKNGVPRFPVALRLREDI